MFFLVEMYSNRAKKASVCEGANVVRLSVLVASHFSCFGNLFFGSLVFSVRKYKKLLSKTGQLSTFIYQQHMKRGCCSQYCSSTSTKMHHSTITSQHCTDAP